ncbi:hypothetical protein [Streptomyces cinnamoneus]|uniref:Secreted protein n=1 Tax=Streptomyces cinnamoneus TaxID=53446 RepID=A0A918TC05_STRCJ|nr:hypothetical protein [Streptomyces cinnamoneus]GHC40215.1 hypothetical protein GCM10010507_12910 [Streptomyces cinnamoneus]
MKSRTFRLAPVVAAVTAGLLMAGTAGAAVAAPSEESPSPASSASSPQDDDLSKGHWDKRGSYDDENSCQKAGKEGKSHGTWSDYRCKREYNNDKYRYYWWLYTH